LTIVVPRAADSLSLQLGGDEETIGLRVPDHPFVKKRIASTGPLAATSANRSGLTTPDSIDGIQTQLGKEVDLYIDAGEINNPPSRVISFIEASTVLRDRPFPVDRNSEER
jgi:tRNA A37 threonylcarbamoyladenosine synthetase subunit TsaC/SUA5/YrdC